MNGWCKIWRSMLDHELWTDAPKDWFRVAFACILMANYKPKAWNDGQTEIVIPPGSFITSLEKLAQKTRTTKETVRGCLKHMIATQFITQRTTKRWRLITLVNWERYQARCDDDNTDETIDAPASGPHRDRIEPTKVTPTKEGNHHQRTEERNSDEPLRAARKASGVVGKDSLESDDDEPEIFTDPIGEFRRRLLSRHGPGVEHEAITGYVRHELDNSATTWNEFLSADKAKTTGRVKNPGGYYRALAREVVRSGVNGVSMKRIEEAVRESQQREAKAHEQALAESRAKCSACDILTGLLPSGEPCTCERGQIMQGVLERQGAA